VPQLQAPAVSAAKENKVKLKVLRFRRSVGAKISLHPSLFSSPQSITLHLIPYDVLISLLVAHIFKHLPICAAFKKNQLSAISLYNELTNIWNKGIP